MARPQTSSGQVRILKDIDSGVEDRDVLLVDDILESGRTLGLRSRSLARARGPERPGLRQLDKPGRRAVPLEADFKGFDCPDLFVVGYGMDAAHSYRELPFIGVVE